MRILGLVLASKPTLLNIALLDGKVISYRELYIHYPIQICGHEFLADLFRLDLTEFDIILGVDTGHLSTRPTLIALNKGYP